MKTDFIGFRVDQDQRSRLERMAQEERRTVSNLLRVLIERESQRRGLEKSPRAVIEYSRGDK